MSISDEHLANERALAENRAKLAELKGEYRATLRSAYENEPMFAELIRKNEWVKAKPDLKITGNADFTFSGVPDGWPPGVNGDEVVAEAIKLEVDKHVTDLMGRAGDRNADPAAQSSPSVAKLRRFLE